MTHWQNVELTKRRRSKIIIIGKKSKYFLERMNLAKTTTGPRNKEFYNCSNLKSVNGGAIILNAYG
jgi:hypothetical protein